MAVKVINQTVESQGKVRAELFADTKSDDLSVIPELLQGAELTAGSSVFTATGDIAFMNSNGEWVWQ